ncbi:MAG: hypothetical protein C0602_01485 [Denitrovibrio sp.]|nr:MAG: hypothetical protein C0602_01485 [Denitrovibrio sp.]
MKTKLLLLLLITIFVTQTAISAQENEKPSSVTISYIEHIPPFWFRDSDGELHGIGPDYWRLWGEKMGIEVQFYITTWSDSLDAIRRGDADFHSGMVPSIERKLVFDFANQQTVMTEEYLFVRKDLGAKNPSDLNKIPIWTDGGISEKLLKERFKGLTLISADDYSVINEQIKNKTMTAFVMDEDIAAYNLAKLDAAGRYKKVYSVYKQPLFAAVAKGNDKMLKLIDEGHAKISQQEFSNIYKKYIASKVQYPEWLKRALIIGFIVIILCFFIIYSLLTKYQVNKKTKELREALQNEQKLRVEKERLLVHKSKLAQLGEMINSVTHQWKQPLSTIMMIAENIKDIDIYDKEVDREQIMSDAEKIINQVSFMSKTMDDFSGFTSPSERISDFYICDACNDALRLMEHTISYNKIKTYINCEDKISIRGSKNDFVHIIINLLTNSMDAFLSRGIAGGVISIHINQKDNNTVEVVYSDNAGGLQGISENEIFEPYVSTKYEESGTGIGLYLTRNILRKTFKGAIRAKGIENGLSFYIELKN